MNFLDKFDLFLFRRLNENHVPATFKAIKTVFIGGLITSLLIMIVQMSGMAKDTQEVIAGILLIALFGGAMYLVRIPSNPLMYGGNRLFIVSISYFYLLLPLISQCGLL